MKIGIFSIPPIGLGRSARFLVLLCLASILSGRAVAEKGTPQSEWTRILTIQRESLETFEIWTETWRYEILDVTAPILPETVESWARRVGARIESASESREENPAFSVLVEEARTFFGCPPDSAESLSELHRYRGDAGSYRVWERRSGTLSLYEREGTWHQSDGLIAIGPPLSREKVEEFLAKLGLFVPEGAKSLEVPSATPEDREEIALFQVDSEDRRYRYGCCPWNREECPLLFMEEYLVADDGEETLSEKRYFYRKPGGRTIRQTPFALPEAAVEFGFDLDGDLMGFALIHIHPVRTDPAEWTPFPLSRPPFGWRVLDYRFLPEREFVFGDFR